MPTASVLKRGIVALVLVVFAASVMAYGWSPLAGRAGPKSELGRSGQGAVANDNPEAGEQAEGVQQRTEAYQAAVNAGTAGKAQAITNAPASGWAGEKVVSATADDWEPAIAADPHSTYVYALVTRYGDTKPCKGNCPSPYHALIVSSDGGATWGAAVPLCACKGSGQFDPIIEVVPNTGAVYAAYLNGFNVYFVKSTNHGTTWSTTVPVYGNVSWTDKPVLATSDDGKDVYIGFNGPTGGDPYVAISHDSGATWTQKKLADTAYYYFNFDADVAPDGTVYIAESALLYGGGGNKGTYPTAPIVEHVFYSIDKGTTWNDQTVASVQPGVQCVAAGCTPDYYLGHDALSVDANGHVVMLYDGATTVGGPQTIWSKSSAGRGAAWSATAVAVSNSAEEATAPAMESTGNGDVRAFYFQTTGNNPDVWNVYYTTSTNGGASWSAGVRISDASSGAAYKTAAGFAEVYGDYGEMAITSTGKTIAIWGEGTSYTGPGGCWINRQT